MTLVLVHSQCSIFADISAFIFMPYWIHNHRIFCHSGSWLQQHTYFLHQQFQLYLLGSNWREVQVWWIFLFGVANILLYLVLRKYFSKTCYVFLCYRRNFDCCANSCINSTLRCYPLSGWRTASTYSRSGWANSVNVYIHVRLCKGPEGFGAKALLSLDCMVFHEHSRYLIMQRDWSVVIFDILYYYWLGFQGMRLDGHFALLAGHSRCVLFYQ